MVSFRGLKKVGPSPNLSPLGGSTQNCRRASPLRGALPVRVPNRFFKMRGLPYLNARIRDFTAKLGRRWGLKVVHWARDAGRTMQVLEYNYRVYGTGQKCGSE